MSALVTISSQLFRDPRLSGTAKGVFGHLCTYDDGDAINPEMIARYMRDGVVEIESALLELERYGYLARTKIRNADDTMGPSSYKITDIPPGVGDSEPAVGPSTDERAILAIFAKASGPLPIFDATDSVNPPPTKRDGRSREHKAWQERRLDLLRVAVALWKQGLIEETIPADGEKGSKLSITDTGRAALAAEAGAP